MSINSVVEQFIVHPHVNFLLTYDTLEEPNKGLRMNELRAMRSTAENIRSVTEQNFNLARLTYQVVNTLYTSAPLNIRENLGVDFLAYQKVLESFREASDAFHRIDATYDAICYAINIEEVDSV